MQSNLLFAQPQPHVFFISDTVYIVLVSLLVLVFCC
jgi:hypothetical protein